MIYTELISLSPSTYTHSTAELVYHSTDAAKESFLNYDFHSRMTAMCAGLDHYFSPEFTGVNFTTELSNTYLRKRTFEVSHQGSIPGFLHSTLFGTADSPSAHVTSIHVSMDKYSNKTGCIRDWSSPKYHKPIKHHCEEAVKCFKGLQTLPVRRDSTLRLTFSEGVERTTKLLEVLVPFVYDMKDKGWTVSVEGSECSTLNINFDITREEWNERIETRSFFVSFHLLLRALLTEPRRLMTRRN